MDERSAGLLIVAAGAVAGLVGLGVYAGAFSWFGRLPGDNRVEGESVRIYIPLVSMVLVSCILTLVLYVLRRFF
jgi:hypothetical protein